MNIYPSTLESICNDLDSQIQNDNRKDLIPMIKEALDIYVKYNYPNKNILRMVSLYSLN